MKTRICLLAAALACFTGSGWAQEWAGAGGNQLWSNGANWLGGAVPNSWPSIAQIDANLAGPIIDGSVNTPYVGIAGLNIGDSGNGVGTLTMIGGRLSVGTQQNGFPGYGWVVLGFGDGTNPNTHGLLNMQGGDLEARWDLIVGAHGGGNGTIDMTGGTIWAHRLSVGTFAGTGQINLHNGIMAFPFVADPVNTANGTLISIGNGNIDIEQGQMHILGDFTAQMQNYVGAGKITGYEGAGSVLVDYNNVIAGVTVVYAVVPEPSAMAMVGLGSVALLLKRRKSR